MEKLEEEEGEGRCSRLVAADRRVGQSSPSDRRQEGRERPGGRRSRENEGKTAGGARQEKRTDPISSRNLLKGNPKAQNAPDSSVLQNTHMSSEMESSRRARRSHGLGSSIGVTVPKVNFWSTPGVLIKLN